MAAVKISVIMGIYNCAEYLDAAIQSIIHQTYSNWELILCDDGSTDNTYEIAKNYTSLYPEKIKLIKNPENLGLNKTLNKCLRLAEGEYIARMDGDDISLPHRFETEVAFLDSHPDYAIVSCPMDYFDQDGIFASASVRSEIPQKQDFLKGTPFCHAPCMVRREAYLAVDGYTEAPKFLRVEDYNLWVKMYRAGFRGFNLSAPLYQMRDDRNAANRRKFKYRFHEVYAIGNAIHLLQLPKWSYLYTLRPLLVGLLPTKLYEYLHKRKLKQLQCGDNL